MAEEEDAEQVLTNTFKEFDQNGDGKLGFEEFFQILHALNPAYKKDETFSLFTICDQDLSGDLDVDEFIKWICGSDNMVQLFNLEEDSLEEEAKSALLNKPFNLRREAAKGVKDRGENWAKMTWRHRLEEVRDLEKSSMSNTVKRTQNAPCNIEKSSFQARERGVSAAEARPASPVSPDCGTRSRAQDLEAGHVRQKKKAEKHVEEKQAAPQGNFAVADMEQVQMVSYCLKDSDIAFAGFDTDVYALRDAMKTHCPPEELLDIVKFIAKGTAGWVFLAKDKESGTEVAMKVIRMTQAALGMKEWFVSKKLMEKGVQGVVTTYSTVCVLARDTAPPVIKEQLMNAGPCPYYMCMLQELMPWGTLEDLAEEGELSPEILFMAMEDVSSSLANMHANGIAHKDVKPENIMLEMEGRCVVAAKLCDFGSAEVGNNRLARENDIRRFGVTLFSVATGEMWTKNRLIHAEHKDLVSRLRVVVRNSPNEHMRKLPSVLEQILDGGIDMKQVATLMAELEGKS